jgi:hypothetical protein
MKSLKYIFATLLLLSLLSCFETEERFEFRTEQSGDYVVRTDMSKMVEMFNSMAQLPEDSLEMMSKDTLFLFKRYTDTAGNLTAEEKRLFREGTLQLTADWIKEKLIVTMRVPFKSTEDLIKIRKGLPAIAQKIGVDKETSNSMDMGNLLGLGAGENNNGELNNPGSGSVPSFNFAYELMITPNSMKNILRDTAAFREITGNAETRDAMSQVSVMMGDALSKTVIILPKPVKNFNGMNGVLSDDKRTITFSYPFMDVIEKPEMAEFKIEY